MEDEKGAKKIGILNLKFRRVVWRFEIGIAGSMIWMICGNKINKLGMILGNVGWLEKEIS